MVGLLVALVGGVVGAVVYRWIRWREDFLPGRPPDVRLTPHAWTTTAEAITFAVLGDNGSGGRKAMAVARQMARTYRSDPFGVVLLAGDVSYYGSIDDRWEQVFVRPYRPLIDAGVTWELAIGNHDLEGRKGRAAAAEVAAQLRRFGTPGTYYSAIHGPMELFVLDSSVPLATGRGAGEQLAWLEQALSRSEARWKVALMHHPGYSSGKHGSYLQVREAVQPLFAAYGVDVVFTGHDHHYERTTPQDGVVWIVSGAGCKLTPVGRSDFTAHAESTLQFVLGRVHGDTMELEAITTDGSVIDRVALTARSA